MTLQQLKYVITVAETGTITEAANRLYVSQPSLTNAIHELEKEMNIVIFNRTNKGITLSKEGDAFLGYARQVLEQAAILEDKYKGNPGGKKQFCVSTQHYSFAVNAFVDLIKQYGQEEYDFSLRETQTYEIIEDVARLRSEIGEEIFSDFERRKNSRVRDRATLFNLLIGLNGYTVCSGVIDKKLNGKDIIAVPLADESDMRIGYITHRKGMLSRLGTTYLEALQKYLG